MGHADGHLVHDAGRVGSVSGGPLGGHQVGYCAGGAQGGRCGVSVKVGLTGQVRCSQVRVDSAVAGAAVWEGIWRLCDGWSNIGLLPPGIHSALCGEVWRCLAEVQWLLLLESVDPQPLLPV